MDLHGSILQVFLPLLDLRLFIVLLLIVRDVVPFDLLVVLLDDAAWDPALHDIGMLRTFQFSIQLILEVVVLRDWWQGPASIRSSRARRPIFRGWAWPAFTRFFGFLLVGSLRVPWPSCGVLEVDRHHVLVVVEARDFLWHQRTSHRRCSRPPA